MVQFGTVMLPFGLVIVLGVVFTLMLVSGFSFASRGVVYDLVMPPRHQLRQRTGHRRIW
ncbi:MAG: hypothetical protein M3R24_12785 [Chloroflexota bacterium]|nr:hypothetical protein [Chloroflexota bacterium]